MSSINADTEEFKRRILAAQSLPPVEQAKLLQDCVGVLMKWVTELPSPELAFLIDVRNGNRYMEAMAEHMKFWDTGFERSQDRVEKFKAGLTESKVRSDALVGAIDRFLVLAHSKQFDDALTRLERMVTVLEKLRGLHKEGFFVDALFPLIRQGDYNEKNMGTSPLPPEPGKEVCGE